MPSPVLTQASHQLRVAKPLRYAVYRLARFKQNQRSRAATGAESNLWVFIGVNLNDFELALS
jgi:hypothetical protein